MKILGRSLQEIVEDMRQYANSKGLNIQNFNANPVAMTYIETSAHQTELLEIMAEGIQSHFFIDDMEGEDLDKRLGERGLSPRYEGKKASGYVIGNKSSLAAFVIGSAILKDTVFKTLDGATEVVVTADTNVIIGQTTVSIPVECTVIGKAGNLLPNTELTYSGVAIAEIEVLKVSTDGLSGGLDAESDDEVKARLKEDMQKTSTSANKNQCIKWAKEVEGVGDAICIPLWNGQNTSKVVIVDKDKLPASPELVQAAQDYIDPGVTGLGDGTGPIGLYITVAAAAELQIIVSAVLELEAGYTLEQVTPIIDTALKEYYKSLVFKETLVRYNYIGDIINDTEGVIDHSGLTVNGGTANISIPEGSVPVKGANVWTT